MYRDRITMPRANSQHKSRYICVEALQPAMSSAEFHFLQVSANNTKQEFHSSRVHAHARRERGSFGTFFFSSSRRVQTSSVIARLISSTRDAPPRRLSRKATRGARARDFFTFSLFFFFFFFFRYSCCVIFFHNWWFDLGNLRLAISSCGFSSKTYFF